MEVTQISEQDLVKKFHKFPEVPLMHKELFAEHVGVSDGVVQGWDDRNYVLTQKFGKHNLVNLLDLHYRCLAQIEAKRIQVDSE